MESNSSNGETVLVQDLSALTVKESPAATEPPEPVAPHRSHDPENNLKRSDPFQFGSRYLNQEDNVFEFNAWDHVETDDTYKEYAEQQYAKQREAPVSDFDKSKLLLFILLHSLPLHPDDLIMHSSSEATTNERNNTRNVFRSYLNCSFNTPLTFTFMSGSVLTIPKQDSIPTPQNGGTTSTKTTPQTSLRTGSGCSKNFLCCPPLPSHQQVLLRSLK